LEIERKFLVKELPEALETYPRHQIQQAYISTNPVLRLRRWDESYILTYKGPGLLAREEHEFPLSQESYEHLLTKAEGNSITKDRYCIPFLEYTIELDVFSSPFAPLALAEVEFPDEKAANAFQPPEWFGEEVTYDPAYTNAAMSRREFQADPIENMIRPGRYRHFKGNEYEVLYVAKHSETLEPMVVYRALYGEQGVWVRPAAMWNETVTREGKTFRRFTPIEEEENG